MVPCRNCKTNNLKKLLPQIYLNQEMGISLAEIARHLGVGASAIAMAIRKKEHVKRIDDFDQRPPSTRKLGLRNLVRM